ncbi:MAG: MobV family relaxase [Roseivirga sp.]
MMRQFAVLHITKYKGLARIGSHIDRRHYPLHANKSKSDFNEELLETLGLLIAPERSELNEELLEQRPLLPLPEAIEKRIEEGYTQKRALRKDAVKALGVILSGSHERMKQIEADPLLFAQWKQANFVFATELFGRENIVRFTLHRDEKTPHFHCVVVPITPEGQLSARHFINGRDKLREYQDHYAQAMAPFGLERGLTASITLAKHQSTQAYYRAQQGLARDQQGEPVARRSAPRLAIRSAQEHLEAFQAAPPTASLLYCLGFDTPAPFQGLTTSLKASENAIVWGLYKEVTSPEPTLVSTYSLRLNEQGQFCPYFQKGLPRGLALLDTGHIPARIVITESPLEALQRRQGLYYSDRKAFATTLFVSTCGPLTRGIQRELDGLFVLAKEKQLPITFCLPQEMQAACQQRREALSCLLPSQGPFSEAIGELARGLQALAREQGALIEDEEEEESTPKQAKAARKRV